SPAPWTGDSRDNELANARGERTPAGPGLEPFPAPGERGDAFAGAVLFLAGEPGIGKTRLATEVGVYARRRGFRVLMGRCDEAGGAPYQPLAEAVREYLDPAESGRVAQVAPPSIAAALVRLVPQIADKVSL